MVLTKQENILVCLLGVLATSLNFTHKPSCSKINLLLWVSSTSEMWKHPNPTIFLSITFCNVSKPNTLSISFQLQHGPYNIMRCHGVAGNWTQNFWKSSQCSELLNHLSRPIPLQYPKKSYGWRKVVTRTKQMTLRQIRYLLNLQRIWTSFQRLSLKRQP